MKLNLKRIQVYSNSYELVFLHGDFNVEISQTNLAPFCDLCVLNSLIQKVECFKNS